MDADMTYESIVKPKSPDIENENWQPFHVPPQFTLGYAGVGYAHRQGFIVISAVEVAKDKDGIDLGAEYHVSISHNGGRCSSHDAHWILRQFDMEGSTEDNHVPHGVVRNFWKPVAENLIGIKCKCVDDENAIKENKGDFVWRT